MHRIFVDISGLKKVNEHARHDAGDEVSVVEAMREVTRAIDVVARWGGAEFCIVGPVPGMTPPELERRVRDMAALHLPVEPTRGRSRSTPGSDVGAVGLGDAGRVTRQGRPGAEPASFAASRGLARDPAARLRRRHRRDGGGATLYGVTEWGAGVQLSIGSIMAQVLQTSPSEPPWTR